MRLLSPRTAAKNPDTKVADSLESLKLRAQEVEAKTQADRAQAKIKKFDAAYHSFNALIQLYEAIEAEKERISEKFYEFVKETDSKRGVLLSQLKEIESKKKNALDSLEVRRQEVESATQTVQMREQIVAVNESEILKEKGRLDTLAMSLKDCQTKQADREVTLSLSEKDYAKRKRELVRRENEYSLKVQKWEKSSTFKDQQLIKREDEILQKEHALSVMKEEIKKQKEEIKKSKTKLLDERQTLDAAWNELKHV
jgi:hypothetical protein